jgi:hypothetical protein
MKVYLDTCCFNRPFDDQSQIRIRLESEAKLKLQSDIINKKITLIWSYMMDFENHHNPFEERRIRISHWKSLAQIVVLANPLIIDEAKAISALGLKIKDSLHLACAKFEKADFFFTTDDQILRKCHSIEGLQVCNPIEYITKGTGQ